LNQTSERLRRAIEATRLGFGVTVQGIEEFTRAVGALGVQAVCVPGIFVGAARIAANDVPGWAPEFVTVANFPTGDHDPQDVLAETQRAARDGADHIDLVAPGALVGESRWPAVAEFIRRVREQAEESAGRPLAVKVILETAALDEARIRGTAEAAIEAGARWLKTSTGFHPAGGATEEVVRLLRSIAPPEVGVKASGGIRTREQALRMLDAGADRIGTSSVETILQEPSS